MQKDKKSLEEYHDLLSVEDLTEIFRVSKTTIYKEIASGTFGRVLRIGRAYRVPLMHIRSSFFDNHQ